MAAKAGEEAFCWSSRWRHPADYPTRADYGGRKYMHQSFPNCACLQELPLEQEGAGLVLSVLGSETEGICPHLENLTSTCRSAGEKERFCVAPGLASRGGQWARLQGKPECSAFPQHLALSLEQGERLPRKEERNILFEHLGPSCSSWPIPFGSEVALEM